MMRSRRSFLRIGTGAGTVAAMQWPLAGISLAGTFDAFGLKQNDALIRLNSNENAYGPSRSVVAAIGSALGRSNRYARM